MRLLVIAVTLAAMLLGAAGAQATSVAYLDGEEVWVSTLDGARKARLSEGEHDWRAVTAADSGRILGVRNEAGKISQLSKIRLWDRAGTRISDGPLPSRTGWTTVIMPLAMDLSADGVFLAYGYSNSNYGFPLSTFQRGHYWILADTKVGLAPLEAVGETYPSFFGRDLVTVAERTNEIDLQTIGSGPGGTTFTPWFTTASAAPLEQRRVDVAATGTVAAFELVRWDGAGQVEGKIGVLPIAGIGGAPNDPAGCFLPASGLASDVSISQDATRIAWKDDQGVKVAGIPDFSGVDVCTMTSPPVVISATGSSPSIGGAALPLAAVPVAPPPPPAVGGVGSARPPTGTGSAPTGAGGLVVTVASRLAVTRLAARGGLPVDVRVARAGPVRLKLTVPARRVGRRGGAVVVATGSARATKAQQLKVVLRLTPAGRRARARLRGAKATLTITQGTARTTRTLTLR